MIELYKQPKYRILSWSLGLILAIASSTLTFSDVAHANTQANVPQSIKNASSTETSTGSARELFRAAYENRYTWNKQFPGYTAAVEFQQGKEDYKGYIRVNPDLNVEVTGIDKEDARQTVDSQLRMIIIHRQRVPFEVAHKGQTYQLGATDKTGAVEIFEKGDTTDSHYKVLHQQLTQVNRTLGQTAVTVNLLDSLVTPEGYLATRYQTVFRQPQTAQVLGEEESEDSYQKIGGYYLLNRQIIHDFEPGKQTTTKIVFTDIQLLSKSSK
ncbi:MAG: DUF3386 domain-containing protein [Chroococcidiopsidaceae cyanobacterium CP_BM_RX_35]|nr:DUF3386 domain-containing protein [Chroococcidiopsidaceae cyanobacterium CP_BM_RX_35]